VALLALSSPAAPGRLPPPNQHVLIMVYTPAAIPDEETRGKARKNLDRIYAKADARAAQQGVTHDEYDAAVDEAIAHVRGRPPA